MKQFPDLEAIVRIKVKPIRDALGSNPVNTPLKKRWWAFQAHRPDFYEAISPMDRILGVCRVSTYFGVTFIKPGPIFGESVVLFAMSSDASLAILQSRIHESWARTFSSTMRDAMRYSPSDCFETFPFPPDWETNAALETAGREYNKYRAALMVRNDEGLTKTYNRFHDPEERSPDIHQLRALHAAMDHAVLAAYGWPDIPTACEFLLDYEEDEDSDTELTPTANRKGKKKFPWRYRWPDDVRDDVLARLLALNAERYAEEVALGLHSKSSKKASGPAAPGAKRRGRPAKASQASEAERQLSEQMGLGL